MDTISKSVTNRVNPRMLEVEPLRRCELNECKGACCVFGVWVDTREVTDILANAALSPRLCRRIAKFGMVRAGGIQGQKQPRSQAG
jgi:hypothetical protein